MKPTSGTGAPCAAAALDAPVAVACAGVAVVLRVRAGRAGRHLRDKDGECDEEREPGAVRSHRAGWWWGWYPYAYPYPYYYPAPYAAYPPVVVDQGPSVYIQQPVAPAEAAAPAYWYYCPSSKAYYPTVQKCRVAWIKVPPTPQ